MQRRGEGGIGITETKGRVGEGNEGEARAGRDEVRGEEEGNRRGEERVPAYHSSVIIYYQNYLSMLFILLIDYLYLLILSFKNFFFSFIFRFYVSCSRPSSPELA